MALVLNVSEEDTITVNDNITIKVKRKKRSGKNQSGYFKKMFAVSIEAPREVNIGRSNCKNKEDNNV